MCIRDSNNTGIQSIENSSTFGLFPNPTNGNVTVQLSSSNSDVKIEVINALGKIVISENNTELLSEVTLQTAALNKGIYYVKISEGSKSSVQKLILN